jgi:hypothetical protein
MKKPVIILACLAASAATCQEMGTDSVPLNKKGNEILPRKGDLALGFNTIPVLTFFYDALTAEPANSGEIVHYTNNTNNQVTGKYFLGAKTAVRVRFGVNTLGGTITNRVQDAGAMYAASLGTADDIAAAANMRVNDKLQFTKSNIMVAVGLEKRRGYRRLQGFYGAELGFGSTGARETVSYGNVFSDQYPVVYTNNFNSMNTATVNPTTPGRSARVTETRYRGGVRIGLRGFVGIEYFIFAKISIAAEYGWGYSIATQRAAKVTQEVYNNGQNGPQVFTEELNVDSREVLRGFSVDNSNGNAFSFNNTVGGNTALSGGAGALTLFFHF